MNEVPQRKKILRKPFQANYPVYVCDRCARYAVEDCGTVVQDIIHFHLENCRVCGMFTHVTTPQDYGWPTFYTYENGAPVLKGG